MNEQIKGHMLACMTILIWGTTFISTKVLLRDFTPLQILFTRFMIGYLALWAVAPRLTRVKEKKEELYFLAAGLCGVTLYFLMENIALTYTQANNVGIIVAVSPFFTMFFGIWLLKQKRPGVRFFIGFLIAMTGILCISLEGSQNLALNPKGDLLALGAAIVWALYSTITKKISSFGSDDPQNILLRFAVHASGYYAIRYGTAEGGTAYGIKFCQYTVSGTGSQCDVLCFLEQCRTYSGYCTDKCVYLCCAGCHHASIGMDFEGNGHYRRCAWYRDDCIGSSAVAES